MSLKSVALGIISFIIVSLLTIGLSFAGDFDPVMPTSEYFEIKPSGITTSSTPMITIIDLNPNGWLTESTMDQIQIVVSSSTVTYFDGWFVPGLHNADTYHVPVNIPIGTEYVISVRGWNNNGFSEWAISDTNTVVAKGTDCLSNFMRFDEVTSQWIENPACQ